MTKKQKKYTHNLFKLRPRVDSYYRFWFRFDEHLDRIIEYKDSRRFNTMGEEVLSFLFNIALNELIFDKRVKGHLNPYYLNLDATKKSITIEFSLKDKRLYISRVTFKKSLKILERLQFLTIHSCKKGSICVILDVSKCDHAMRLLDKELDKAYNEMGV